MSEQPPPQQYQGYPQGYPQGQPPMAAGQAPGYAYTAQPMPAQQGE